MRGDTLTRRHPACMEASLPYRRLAVRVIDQAFRDASDPAQSKSDRDSARSFLAGSSMLHLWCELADLDPRWMAGRASVVTAGSRRLLGHRGRYGD